MKKVLITGANGYIGSRMVKVLAESGYDVLGHCYPTCPKDPVWKEYLSEIITGDIRSEQTIEKITDRAVDAAIHLVSLDHRQSNGHPQYVSSVNVQPTWNLLDGYFKKTSLSTFVYFSTVQVYGGALKGEVSEETETKPVNAYGLTHKLSEDIGRYFNSNSGINCINVRLSNSYGSPMFKDANCWWLVINDLCQQAVFDKKIVLQSDGSAFRDFIHGDDVCYAVERLISCNNKKNFNTFNISSGSTLSIINLANIITELTKENFGYSCPIILPGNIISPLSTISKTAPYIIANRKIKQMGFTTRVSLSDGINELLKYLKSVR